MRALASVDLTAIEHNVALLASKAPAAQLCAVVKADGYGHGGTQSATAAINGGASWLAVATAIEAQKLRADGIEEPILVMGALTDSELEVALAARSDVVAWSEYFLTKVIALGGGRVHIKFDSGMGRLGTRDRGLASALAARAENDPCVQLIGLMTQFATADQVDDKFFAEQLEAFTEWSDPIVSATPGLIRHAANSAALLSEPASHFDLVRPGVACYGLDPFGIDPAAQGLEPALRLESYVACAERCDTGQSAGYSRTFIADQPTVIGTVPIGYADGWKHAFSNNAEVLIGGSRFAVVGNVSMDNITVDLGADGGGVELGERVTLIGADGADRILSEQLAGAARTINYEIVTSIGPRVERQYVRSESGVQ